MLWTDKSKIITYGIASAAGVIAGSAAYALAIEDLPLGRLPRRRGHGATTSIGGMLMGFGGITALGCTIGQAITGFSTLALGSIITFAAIVAGSARDDEVAILANDAPGLIKSRPFSAFRNHNSRVVSSAGRAADF